MQVKHAIAEPWRSHFQEVQKAIQQDSNNIAILRGQIAEIEQTRTHRKAHAGDLITLICKEAELPQAIGNYSLSEDGCFLVGEINDPVPPPTEPTVETPA